MPGVADDTFAALGVPVLRIMPLSKMVGGARFSALDRLDAYASGRQYNGLKYDWNGNLDGYGAVADIAPGWYVPLDLRRPSTTMDLGRLIILRFTSMIFGEGVDPVPKIDGDPEADDYARALVKSSKILQKMQEARNKGGAVGTAVMSYGFVSGRPRVTVHNAKHIHVLSWSDRFEFRPSAVLESWGYTKIEIVDGAPQEKQYFHARYWDESIEVIWEAIPKEIAADLDWSAWPRQTVAHNYGECPVYWCQNFPDCESIDGVSDIYGLGPGIDSINRLMSATAKGTIANVDPTLVIKDQAANNTGSVKKGQGAAIYAPGGAEFLELKGDAVRTALELSAQMKQDCLDVAGVVLADPHKVASQAQSAAALKLVYLPMLQRVGVYRTTYGGMLVQMLGGMMRAAKKIGSNPPGEIVTLADGQRVQLAPTVILPDRVEYSTVGGERVPRMVPRTPGTSEEIELIWPNVFPATMADVTEAGKAANEATGRTISALTAVKFMAPFFGVQDPDLELAEIEAERAEQMAQAGALESDPKLPTTMSAPSPSEPPEDDGDDSAGQD